MHYKKLNSTHQEKLNSSHHKRLDSVHQEKLNSSSINNTLKKAVLVPTIAILLSTFLCGCLGRNNTNTATDTKLKIGLVTTQGGVKDGSFNEAADKGVLSASEELGIERLNPIESNQQEQYQPNLKTMASIADLTIGAGFLMESSMKAVSEQMPDKKFLMVDAVISNPNVLSILFKEQEGAYLAGVLAGSLTKTNKIGIVGGKESAVLERFEAGFIAGVASVNPAAAKDLMPLSSNTHGSFVKYINDFTDQSKAKEAANMLYNSGADIIFHTAAGAGEGVFKAAEEKNLYAIGVDSDQAVTLPQYSKVILFSMVKKVDEAVVKGIKNLQEGNFQGGETIVLGVKENGVGISDTINAMVTEDSKKLADKAKEEIISERITVPETLGALLKFQPPSLNK